MKKAIALVMLVAVLSVAGCQSERASPRQQTLDIALWDEKAKPAVDEAIAAFENKHPDVRVNVTYSPYSQYWTPLGRA